MPDILFVRTRYVYDSYSDLVSLITLSGYPLVYVDEIQPDSDNTYIVICANGEWSNGWPDARARIIFLQLEFQHAAEPLKPGIAEMWTADAAHAALIGARYVPLGSHPDLKLYPTSPNGKVYDVATLWAPCSRRYDAGGDLYRAGVNVAPNGWGEIRHNVLMQSRAMLSVHQWDEHPYVGAQRWAIAATYGLPMLTETLRDPGIFAQLGMGRYMSDLAHIGDFVSNWMQPKHTGALAEYGQALHELLCVEHSFKKIIEGAV